jgi:outer membrane lipoprotein-sorting protein
MCCKTLFLVFFFATALFAKSYNFSELRYSDATGRYKQLNGIIEFSKDGLELEYKKEGRKLLYDGENVEYFQNGKEVALATKTQNYLSYYFEILKLLHEGDESELRENFSVKEEELKTVLLPLGSMRYYIDSIELQKEQKELRYVKLFLKNKDTITIHIENETE